MIVFDEIDVGLGYDVDARNEIVSVVALLDPPLLHGDVSIKRIADAHDRRALQLRAHAIRIDDRAAIDRHVEPRYRDLPVIADGDMCDDRDITEKAAMHRDAAALPRRQLLAPIAVRDGEVEHTAQSTGIDQ